jgi:hypothetical protein
MKLNDTTFIIEPSDVEIGDIKQEEFYPQIKLKKWNNDSNFSVRFSVPIEGSDFEENDDGSISWYSPYGDVVSTFYSVPLENFEYDNSRPDESIYEFQIELYDKPSTNILPFTIKTKNLNFFKQPFLTQEEKDNGDEQEEIVGGSYAVYHSSKFNNEYKTGKAFQIFRPKLIDNTGNICFGDINIDTTAEILTVTIPQDFIDNAVYPIRHAAGLTLGYTTQPSNTGASAADISYTYGGSGTPNASSTGLVDRIYFCTRSRTTVRNCKVAIWNSDKTLLANSPVTYSSLPASATFRYLEYTGTKPIITSGNNYFFGYISGGSLWLTYSFDYIDGVYNVGGYAGASYSNPGTLGSLNNTLRKHGVYITYTPSVHSPLPCRKA